MNKLQGSFNTEPDENDDECCVVTSQPNNTPVL